MKFVMNVSTAKSIKPINKEAIHRICSGQVVLTLAVAVKELVENSLDAGATVIDIRLRDFGSELVEVTDNGSGVEPGNFQALTLKHHTSKLQEFSDLINVDTFGFRGEALSSLCALSDVSVITRHKDADCGTKLVFDHSGKIVSSIPVARQVGTTVCLENLFSSLPVRHKEFHRNLKREFTKMVQLLYAYCLVSTGIRISCINQTKNGTRTTVVSTQGCKTVRENIACVFGTKQLLNLMEISCVKPSSEVLEEFGITECEASVFNLNGFISTCAHSHGRGTNDRQFYYINSRPCEPSKIMKLVNEVYHQFNIHQSPFVFLNIEVTKGHVDVNVTPDKRQIFVDQEKLLLATVKASLLALYSSVPSTFTINNVPNIMPVKCSSLSTENKQNKLCTAALLSKWRHNNDKRPLDDKNDRNQPKQMKLDSLIAISSKQKSNLPISNNADRSDGIMASGQNKTIRTAECSVSIDMGNIVSDSDSNISNKGDVTSASKYMLLNINCSEDNGKVYVGNEYVGIKTDVNARYKAISCNIENINRQSEDVTHEDVISSEIFDSSMLSLSGSISESDVNGSSQECLKEDNSESGGDLTFDSTITNQVQVLNTIKNSEDNQENKGVMSDELESYATSDRITCEVAVSISELVEITRIRKEKAASISKDEKKVRFRAIIDPTRNLQAEQELSREITKDMFAEMEVIGQFNLGFIIARLGSDLFIIDQHATDEKYNFETLQRTTTLSNQKLVVPQQLELTAVNESILLESIDVFRSNGFEFHIDESAPVTHKISLTAIPMSRNWTFGKEDIDELLFMLQDAPNTLCRPSRVRAMFASRACRKSVMIGTALSQSEMQQLILHMGEIEQPWNCPHGRPTMRHLVNLDYI